MVLVPQGHLAGDQPEELSIGPLWYNQALMRCPEVRMMIIVLLDHVLLLPVCQPVQLPGLQLHPLSRHSLSHVLNISKASNILYKSACLLSSYLPTAPGSTRQFQALQEDWTEEAR